MRLFLGLYLKVLVLVYVLKLSAYIVYTVHVSEVINSLQFLELSENASLFTGVDDDSVLFQFPSPFQFYNESYNSAFVRQNAMNIYNTLVIFLFLPKKRYPAMV